MKLPARLVRNGVGKFSAADPEKAENKPGERTQARTTEFPAKLDHGKRRRG